MSTAHRRQAVRGYFRDLSPIEPTGIYADAVRRLAASTRTHIAQIDSGLAPHPSLGYAGKTPPAHILLDEGRNLYDPRIIDGLYTTKPITDLSRSGAFAAEMLEFPDHGVKTLSVILGDDPNTIRGVAPGAKVIPYRVANGPLFRKESGSLTVADKSRKAMAQALRSVLAHRLPVRVVSISMGNPEFLGPVELARLAMGGRIGMGSEVRNAAQAAYNAGIIIVCAAGQVISSVIEPASYGTTIAVGGFDMTGQNFSHYPAEGYAQPQLVDIWAQAQRINRAGFAHDLTPIHADDPRDPGGDPSGTSYATPQVAAAAALWVETHHAALENLASNRGGNRSVIVEAFRRALRASADDLDATLPGRSPTRIKGLNIPKLLRTAP